MILGVVKLYKEGLLSFEQLIAAQDKINKSMSFSQEEISKMRIEKRDFLKKSFDAGILTLDQFAKGVRDVSHLVPKKVQVKGKDGKMYMSTRWVDPTTGEAVKLYDKRESKDTGDLHSSLTDILRSSDSDVDKLKDLVNLGIYDKNVLSLLTGAGSKQVYSSLYSASQMTNKDLSKLGSEDTSGRGIKVGTKPMNEAKPEGEEGETEKKKDDKSDAVKEIIRNEQAKSDTPEGREECEVLRTIPIDELWDNYKRNLKRVMTGRHKFACAYGMGGVGKTYTFETLAEEMELREYDEEVAPSSDQYDYVVIGGKISPAQVYAEMYRHRDKLIVFDDCDSFLKQEEVQGFLKRGLDTGKGNKIDYKSSRKMHVIDGDPESPTIPSVFKFEGSVIAITNLTAQQLDQAVRSRALTSNLTMTVDETMDQLAKIKDKIKIYTADKKSVIEVSQKARDMAFSLLGKHKKELAGDLNTRVFSNAILTVEDGLLDGLSDDRIAREVEGLFESVTGAFDEKIRKVSGKK